MTADMVIEEMRPKLNRVPGVRVTLTNPPAIRIGGGPGMGRGGGYQVALQDPDTDELYRVAPQFEAAAHELEPAARLAKVDTQSQPTLAQRYAIRSIPTLVLFRQGREIARQAGAMAAADIVRWTRTQLAGVHY